MTSSLVKKITESTANIIAEPMHVKCDVDRNEYFMLDSLIKHRKTDNAESQKTIKASLPSESQQLAVTLVASGRMAPLLERHYLSNCT